MLVAKLVNVKAMHWVVPLDPLKVMRMAVRSAISTAGYLVGPLVVDWVE